MASREIQRRVWGAPDNFLYPSDIYSAEFAAGTSLIARVEGKTAGFLFGFYAFDGASMPADWQERYHGAFRIESQTLGSCRFPAGYVSPTCSKSARRSLPGAKGSASSPGQVHCERTRRSTSGCSRRWRASLRPTSTHFGMN